MNPLARLYRFYTDAKIAVAATFRILNGIGMWFMALFAVTIGCFCGEWQQALISAANAVSAVSFLFALWLLKRGAVVILDALPGVTPRRINDAPGRSRLANRSELRRGRII